jgi:hypothetical protein
VVDAVSYNLLGRVTSSTRVLAERDRWGGLHVVVDVRHSLGRALTTTLPTPASAGAEMLTTTYNARGLFETSSGIDDETSFVYVSSTDYIPAYAGTAAAATSRRGWNRGTAEWRKARNSMAGQRCGIEDRRGG